MSDVHRDNPEATPEEIENIQRAELLGLRRDGTVEPPSQEGRIVRTCIQCGDLFSVPEEARHKHGKWYSRCSWCLVDEL